jgi:hypothetical protein
MQRPILNQPFFFTGVVFVEALPALDRSVPVLGAHLALRARVAIRVERLLAVGARRVVVEAAPIAAAASTIIAPTATSAATAAIA